MLSTIFEEQEAMPGAGRLLAKATHCDQGGRIGRSRNCSRSNQRFEPDILRNVVGDRNAKGPLELMAVLRIGHEPPCCLGTFLLQALQRQHASVVSGIGEKGNGCIVFSKSPGPAKAFVS